MNLEERLISTLRRADNFEPSPDLFARMERSLEEDLRHRRRVWWLAASLIVAVTLAAFYLTSVISVSSDGRLTAPGWTLELLTIVVEVALILTLGPTLRRFGKPLIADVFRFDPATGDRFMILLNLAFYLFLTGVVLTNINFEIWDQTMVLGEDAWLWRDSVAVFLLLMGLAHAGTIAALPLIGLFFSSTIRRARRRQAGAAAPRPSARAERAERVVRLIVWGIAGSAMFAVLIGVLFIVVVNGLIRT